MSETALREELVDTNPARRAERPKRPRRGWRVLEPEEVSAGRWIEQARVVYLTLVLTGVRRHELLGLRWRDVDLIENVLRVVKSKSDAGERTIGLPPGLAEELWQHRRRSAYRGEDELVFCHPERGSELDHGRFAADRAARSATSTGYKVVPT